MAMGNASRFVFNCQNFVRTDLTKKTNDDVVPEMLRPDTPRDQIDAISEFLPVDKVGICVNKCNALDFTMKSPWRSLPPYLWERDLSLSVIGKYSI